MSVRFIPVLAGVAIASGCVHVGPGSPCIPIRETGQSGFIVTYKEGVDPVATTERYAKKYSFRPRYVYTQALKGFAADLSRRALNGVSCEPEVLRIEPDAQVKAAQIESRLVEQGRN